MFAPLIASLALSSVVYAVPSTIGRRATAPQSIPSIWKPIGSALGSAPLTFTLVLHPAQDSSILDAKIAQIAADHNTQWLTQEELATYVAPSADAKAAVENAVQAIGATLKYSALGDKVSVTTTVAQASKVMPDFVLSISNHSFERGFLLAIRLVFCYNIQELYLRRSEIGDGYPYDRIHTPCLHIAVH